MEFHIYKRDYNRFHFVATVCAETPFDAAHYYFDLTQKEECYVREGSSYQYYHREEIAVGD